MVNDAYFALSFLELYPGCGWGVLVLKSAGGRLMISKYHRIRSGEGAISTYFGLSLESRQPRLLEDFYKYHGRINLYSPQRGRVRVPWWFGELRWDGGGTTLLLRSYYRVARSWELQLASPIPLRHFCSQLRKVGNLRP